MLLPPKKRRSNRVIDEAGPVVQHEPVQPEPAVQGPQEAALPVLFERSILIGFTQKKQIRLSVTAKQHFGNRSRNVKLVVDGEVISLAYRVSGPEKRPYFVDWSSLKRRDLVEGQSRILFHTVDGNGNFPVSFVI